MAAKFVVFAALLAVAHCSVIAPLTRVDADYTNFAYDFADRYTGDYRSHVFASPTAYTAPTFFGRNGFTAGNGYVAAGTVAAGAYAPAYYSRSPFTYAAYSAPFSYW